MTQESDNLMLAFYEGGDCMIEEDEPPKPLPEPTPTVTKPPPISSRPTPSSTLEIDQTRHADPTVLVQLHIKQENEADTHNLLALVERHLDLHVQPVQQAVSVDVLLPACDDGYPHVVHQEGVDRAER